MTIRTLAAAALLAAPLAATAAETKVPQLDLSSFHAKAKMTTNASGQDMSIDSEWWVKGKKMRMEIKASMGQQTSIVDGAFVYMWPSGQKSGMKMAVSPENSSGSLTAANDCLKNARDLGPDSIDGVATEKYEYKDCGTQKGITTTIWIATATRAPKKMVATGSSGTTTILWTDTQVNAPIADSQFVPPADVKFNDMSAMAKQAQQGRGGAAEPVPQKKH